MNHAIEHLMPLHLERIRGPRDERLNKTERAVQERLSQAINHHDGRAAHFRAREATGKVNARLNRIQEEQKADDLQERLEARLEQIAQERLISAARPTVRGGALIIPIGALQGKNIDPQVIDTRASEAIAMAAVMETERALGNKPKDVSDQRGIGYDIESQSGADGRLRFIEVKGRRKGASDVTLTKNELITALNSPEQFILALVEIDGEQATNVRYLQGYDFKEPKAAQFNLKQLIAESSAPR